ncbi:MAG: DUF2147 domain-containing protein [Spirochaetes bacterium]|nr:MAG: DUF2147 domain-containing protein [Spirochaetota bacterium]
MKPLARGVVAILCTAVLCCLCGGTVNAAFPEEGYWKSVDDKTGMATAYWLFTVDGGVLSGFIISYPNMKPDDTCTACSGGAEDWNNKPITGTAWLQLTERTAEGIWENGYIIDSKKGAKYKAKVWLEDGNLKMRGYVGFMYSTQTWYRTTKEQAEAGEF